MARFSLVIGINKYQSLTISPLEFAVSDAEEFAASLSRRGMYEVPSENSTLLLDSAATRVSIIDAVNMLAERASPEDVVVFYYAGHGSSEVTKKGDPDDNLRKYLVPYDTDLKSIDSSAIDFHFLAQRLQRVRARRMLMVFDCCYSGAAGGRTVQVPGYRGSALPVGTKYLEPISGAGRIVFTACTRSEVAQERHDLRHGVFTNFILDGLTGRADYRRDGHIDVDELWMYAEQLTVQSTGREQTPVRSGWTEGDPFYLAAAQTREATAAHKETLRQEIVERYAAQRLQDVLIADTDDLANVASEAAAYLESRIRSNMKIAVSCGRTLIETISVLPRLRVSNVEIFPLNGSPTDEVHLTDSMVLTYLLWSRFEPGKARAHVVPTGIPAHLFARVQSEVAELAGRILEQAQSADVFLFGIGSPSRSNQNIPYLLEKAALTADDIRLFGAVGEINFHLYDGSGQFLADREDLESGAREKMAAYNSKFFSLSTKALSAISRSSGVDLVVVAGGAEKREAIGAAIRGGFVRTLITDIFTAAWLARS